MSNKTVENANGVKQPKNKKRFYLDKMKDKKKAVAIEAKKEKAFNNNANNPKANSYDPIKHEFEKLKANISNPNYSEVKREKIINLIKAINEAKGDDLAGAENIVKNGLKANKKAFSKEAINPSHYKKHSIECIQVREVMTSTLLSDCLKYVWRMGLKDNAKQDYEKALWYLSRFERNCEANNLYTEANDDTEAQEYLDAIYYDVAFVEAIDNLNTMDDDKKDTLVYLLSIDYGIKQNKVYKSLIADCKESMNRAYKNSLVF